jgi:hypothetical protein
MTIASMHLTSSVAMIIGKKPKANARIGAITTWTSIKPMPSAENRSLRVNWFETAGSDWQIPRHQFDRDHEFLPNDADLGVLSRRILWHLQVGNGMAVPVFPHDKKLERADLRVIENEGRRAHEAVFAARYFRLVFKVPELNTRPPQGTA